MRSQVSRADLLAIAAALGREAMLETARGLGYEPAAPQEAAKPPPGDPPRGRGRPRPRVAQVKEHKIPFWQPVSIEIVDDEDQRALLRRVEAQEAAAEVQRPWEGSDDPPPATPPLSPWRRTGPQLQRALTAERVGRRLDLRTLLRRWCRGSFLRRLPRRTCRTWVPALVLVDRSLRLAPFWDDQDGLVRELRRVLGREGLVVRTLPEGIEESAATAWARLGAPVLALSDLGWYGGEDDRGAWLRVGRELARARVALHALAPVPPGRWTDELAMAWRALAWERPTPSSQVRLDPQDLEVRVGRLLRLLGPAMRIEPGLIRALRLLLPRDEADAGTEADLWGRPELGPPFPEFRALLPEMADELRRSFLRATDADPRAVMAVLRAWHWNSARRPEAWHLEVLALAGAHAEVAQGTDAQLPLDAAEVELQRAQHFIRWLAGDTRAQTREGTPEDRAAALRAWCRFVGEQERQFRSSETPAGEALQIIAHAVGADLPGLDPRLRVLVELPPPTPPTLREYPLRQIGGRLGTTTHSLDESGSPIATVFAQRPELYPSSGGTLSLGRPGRNALPPAGALELRTDRSTLRLREFVKPAWAQAIGRDHHGLWVELDVKGVTFRMRWIPPGRFLMGSPEDEPGHLSGEGPQHLVTLTQGFWLGETPVTQALWQAVTRKNPSRFKSPDRPVEMVTWEDCQVMLRKLNKVSRDPQVGPFRLPTEAEWEYACRAGTSTATYAGPIEILGENNAPVLEEIAWYVGNSGVDYDLAVGEDSSGWPNKRHEHSKAGTRRVGLKQANQWGLHDMLGNVWEWCSDWYSEYSSAAQTDPVGAAAGVLRVIRGGSWGSQAGFVRAAYRSVDLPGGRGHALGLRLARDQGVRQDPGPGGPESGRGAGRA